MVHNHTNALDCTATYNFFYGYELYIGDFGDKIVFVWGDQNWCTHIDVEFYVIFWLEKACIIEKAFNTW